MNKNKKPNSYNFFKGEKYRNDNNTNKAKFKKYFKWVKVFLYVFLFAVTLTGCVQSFVLANSSTVGSGVEYYNSKDQISPNSTVFTKEEYGYSKSPSQSSVINGKTDNDLAIIKRLQTISKAHGGTHGEYDATSSLIIFSDDVENKDARQIEVIETATGDNKILYFNSTFKTYEKQTIWKEFYVPTSNINFEKIKDAPKPFAGSIYKVSSQDLGPDAPLRAVFARDVLQLLYDKMIMLDVYKDGKLEAALKEVNEKGASATPSNYELVEKFSEYTHSILRTTFFNYRSKDEVLNYNYLDLNPIVYSSTPSKPLTSWKEAWELGPFFGIVWYPLAAMMGAIIYSLPLLAGWESIIAILIAIIATRLFTLLFTFKSIFAQSKQEELQFKKAKIDAKYVAYKGNKQMEQRQRQEVSEMYKKNNFSPFAMFGTVLISMPIFLGMWRVVQGIAAIKSTTWLGINFAASSWQELLYQGAWIYLPLLITTLIVQLGAQLLPRLLNRRKRNRIMNENEIAAMKKQQKTQNIMTMVFMLFYLIWQAGIQIYSIFGGIWTIFQALAVHYYKKTKHFKEKMKPWLFNEKK